MRIIHLSCVAPPEVGGIGRVAFLETQSLIERGYDAVLYAPGRTSDPSAAFVHRFRSLSIGNAAVFLDSSLLRELRRADIVHLHYPFYGTAEIVVLLRALKRIKRLVVTLHMDSRASGLRGRAFDLHREFIQSRMLRRADRLLVSSLDYARHSSFASFADKAVELPFGVDEKKFSPVIPAKAGIQEIDELHRLKPSGLDSRLRRNDAIERTPIIGFLGGMDTPHAFKGVPVLLRALAQVQEPFEAVLAGDGDLRPSYEHLATSLGLQDRVRFVGRLTDADVPSFYRSLDMCVFPSTSSAEAFGLVALEAQSCGVPVIASDLPGVRTVIQDEKTGVLVKPNDDKALARALERLLADPELRRGMGERARQNVVEKFTWEKHMDQLVNVYDDLSVIPAKAGIQEIDKRNQLKSSGLDSRLRGNDTSEANDTD